MSKILVSLFSLLILVGCQNINENDSISTEKEELFTYEEVEIIGRIIERQYEKFLTTEHLIIIAIDPETNELIEVHILKNAPFYLKNPKDMMELEIEHRDEIENNRPNIEEYDIRQMAKR